MSSILVQLNQSRLDKRLLRHYYYNLEQPSDKVQAVYIWIDASAETMRSKARTLDFEPKSYKDCPDWDIDGLTTQVLKGPESDAYIRPVAMFRDPFSGDCNYRHSCKKAMDQVADHEPWFGMEQEFIFLDADYYPIGWPKGNGIPPVGPHTCAIGASKVFGRDIVEAHYRACLYAGVNICGTNAEIFPAQWEFQIGICEGIDMGDHLWVARYLLQRIAEDYGVIVSFDPKPVPGNWGGSGCHTNYSTKQTRAEGGIKEIEHMIKKLETKHAEHLRICDADGGLGVHRRLEGTALADSYKQFTVGVAMRRVSIRIPRLVAQQGQGYFEDRRPVAICDPYRVTESIVRTTLL